MKGRRRGIARRLPAVVVVATLLTLCCVGTPVGAQSARLGIATPLQFVDTSAARRQFLDQMVGSPVGEESFERRIADGSGNDRVLVRMYEQLGNRYYAFIPVPPGSDEVSLVTPGSYIVRKRLSDGSIDQVKIFLQSHEESYLRLHPRVGHSTVEMDLYLVGALFYRDVHVPMTMERVLAAPLPEVQRATAGIVDWSIVTVDAAHPGYAAVESMVAQIRTVLPTLPDGEDGAMNEKGLLVRIETSAGMDEPTGFNCSGFAKWVIDGLYQPSHGSYLPIEPLKRRHIDHRGTRWSRRLEETRDPYFGLDWTRNLAIQLAAADHGEDPQDLDPEVMDVRSVPTARYREDVGFPVEDLPWILYRLAAIHPGQIYLGSVSRPFGDDVIMRQHSHVVVFLPYFSADGRINAVVMERNAETSTASILERYAGEYVHLTRVDADRPFVPPQFTLNLPIQ
jgi:hypothetical protein